MNIYVAHSSGFDYENELYRPLRESVLNGPHVFLFAHERAEAHSKERIASCDLVLAEVSFPSTGMGIELGWAQSGGVPIVCIHRKDTVPASSLRFVTDRIFGYENASDLVSVVEKALQ